jgi:putative DNA-invertase from lambdoid prophage Rac
MKASSETPTIRCCLYLRVSTSDQNCDLQRRELTEYVQRRGWEVVETYCDLGVSGSKASRPELDRLIRNAALAKFEVCCVWKLDRFGRSVRNCLDGIETLRAHGVRFLAVSQSIDTDESNPTARLLLHILASVAEFERELIRERVRAGIRNARHKGRQLGRKRILFDRSKVIEMHNAGASIREIAAAMQIGRGTIQRFLLTQKPIGIDVPQVRATSASRMAETVGP